MPLFAHTHPRRYFTRRTPPLSGQPLDPWTRPIPCKAQGARIPKTTSSVEGGSRLRTQPKDISAGYSMPSIGLLAVAYSFLGMRPAL